MNHNITLIGINFYPEDTAIGLYSTQMAEYLAKNNSVTVITGFPYYPQWEISSEYRDKKTFLTEQHENITIHRYKQYVPQKPSLKNRIIHLLDFTFGSVRNILKIRECDLVICIVPFTTSILLGIILAKFKNAKVWVHIQDFEFDAAIESGLAGKQNGMKSKIFKVLFWIEKKLLDQADIVSTISYKMMKKLESKTFTQTYFLPNWVDNNFINPLTYKRHRLMQSEKFKVLYSGNIGVKQDWDFFLKVVNHFKENEAIEFIVIGAGAKKEWLVEQTKEFFNVYHYMPIGYAELPDLLCSADLHILFQKNDIIDTVMPSKLLGMMASAKPSIVTGNINSEVAKIFKEVGEGYFFDTEDFSMVVQCLNNFISNQNKTMLIEKSTREYVVKHFSSTNVLYNFEKKIEEILN